MGKRQLHLIDERKDLEFLDKTQVKCADGSVDFATRTTVLESACDKQQVDRLLSW